MSDFIPQTHEWVIWSHEHNAWWRPGHAGYTRLFREAGRYPYDEARSICARANAQCGANNVPEETMLPANCFGHLGRPT